jgi:hypothetical protein
MGLLHFTINFNQGLFTLSQVYTKFNGNYKTPAYSNDIRDPITGIGAMR